MAQSREPNRKQSLALLNGSRSWGGNEAFALQIAQRLHERGHRVLFLWGHDVVGERVREAGIPNAQLVLRADLDLPSLLRLVRHLRRHRADAILLTKWREFLLGSIAARLAGRTRSIVRQGLKISLKSDFKRRLIFRLADSIVVNAEDIRAEFLQHSFVDASKLHVIHNGVDLRRFQPGGDRTAFRAELAIPPDAVLVGSIGSLSGQKGYEHLVEAARTLPNLHFVVLGEGNQRLSLQAQIDAAGMSDRFLLPGFRADVRPFLAALDLFALSSVNEGMARVLLEAMASGLPVVATDVSGTRECVQDGRSGFVVPAHDPAALAKAIQRALAANAHGALGRHSRALAEEKFDEERMLGEFLRLLSAEALGH